MALTTDNTLYSNEIHDKKKRTNTPIMITATFLGFSVLVSGFLTLVEPTGIEYKNSSCTHNRLCNCTVQCMCETYCCCE